MEPLIATTKSELKKESLEITKILKAKTVSINSRNQPEEICIEFTNCTRLFVDKQKDGLKISIT